MIYALLLAGGKGTRMGNTGVPKQFLEINNKPIIVYAINNMIANEIVDKIIVVCNSDYLALLEKILLEYGLKNKVEITVGGKNRLESALKGIEFISDQYGIKENDIFVAHDSVRIFTDKRIIFENVEYASKYGAATTVYWLEETIIEKGEDGLLYRAYPRENRFSGQSPQTFVINRFLDNYAKINDEQKDAFTDLAEVFYANGDKVYPVIGEKNNIKITTPIDMQIAKLRLDEMGEKQ